MPRSPRSISESGYYHVVMRGNGRQILFENDADKGEFVEVLGSETKLHHIKLIAWCLMDNHVHLLPVDPDGLLSDAMCRMESSYARYFNERTGHVGHVFQARFASFPIEDEEYLLGAARYIHNNPRDLGFSAEEYPWSSYHEYVGTPKLTDTSVLLDLLGGKAAFSWFCEDKTYPEMPFEGRQRVTTSEAHEIAVRVLGGVDPAQLKGTPVDVRNKMLHSLWSCGFSIRQIERLTGIGRWTLSAVLTNT